MTIHKEGTFTLVISAVVLMVINMLVKVYLPVLIPLFPILSILLYVFLISFFRHPNRKVPSTISEDDLIAPCDGKVVVIEEAHEHEVVDGPCIQVSIFMSPLNVHVNRHPIDGNISYYRYHPGKYLAAWNPKSSTENERTTVGYQSKKGATVVLRQVAGALARRIVCYVDAGDQVTKGAELGFIKFGSRVDLYLPLDSDIQVNIGQTVKGNIDVIAKLP